MPSLVISEVADTLLIRLRELAAAHGRTPEDEAKAILEDQLQNQAAPIWTKVNAFRNQLAASKRSFGDSTELFREDRER